MESIATPLGPFPIVVIAAATGAAIALLGVILSNWSNTNRLVRQQKHEAREKTKDRITNIRRDIYLTATAEMSDALENIGRMPTFDPRHTDTLAAIKPLSKSLAKIQLICESTTAPLISEVGSKIIQANFEALARCKPIIDLRIESEGEKEMMEFFQSELQQLYKKHELLTESSNPDKVLIARTSQTIAECKKRLEEHMARRLQQSEKMVDLGAQFNANVVALTKPVLDAQIPLVIALRKELELDSDEKEIRGRLEKGLAQISSLLNKTSSVFK